MHLHIIDHIKGMGRDIIVQGAGTRRHDMTKAHATSESEQSTVVLLLQVQRRSRRDKWLHHVFGEVKERESRINEEHCPSAKYQDTLSPR